MRPWSILACVAMLLTVATTKPALPAPYTPADEGEVLERLPESPFGKGGDEARRQLAAQPQNLELATRTAWRYIEAGRASSDPRDYGYAQGVLAPWWNLPEPPPAVLVLRATIRQHDHDFEPALADLDAALKLDPTNAQAWLTRAVILQVRGDYAEARHSCMELLPLAPMLVGAVCINGVASLDGAAVKSYEALRRALTSNSPAAPGARIWGLTLLAEIAARLGRDEAADAHFRQALATGADDYVRAAYADFLLDRDRAEEVRELLRDSTRADALLLRLALAEKALQSPELDEHVRTLSERFLAARGRGDAAHTREEARFALALEGDTAGALALARQNWEVQREPTDARLLMEAALAAGEPGAAAPALAFVERTNLEDIRLAALAAELRAGR